MADYTYNEMMKMQNDAIKRVEEMQKRARQTVGLNEKETNIAEVHNEIPRQEPRRVSMPKDYLENLKSFAANSSHTDEAPVKRMKEKSQKADPTVESAFGDLKLDEDKALLLALILLLSEEGADELLIMALIYMLT